MAELDCVEFISGPFCLAGSERRNDGEGERLSSGLKWWEVEGDFRLTRELLPVLYARPGLFSETAFEVFQESIKVSTSIFVDSFPQKDVGWKINGDCVAVQRE